MNKLLIAAAAFAAIATSFPALADGATYEYPQAAVSSLTRAEVRAELARASANGELVSGERTYVAEAEGPALTRTEVRIALAQARRDGELDLGERSLVPTPSANAAMHVAGR